MKKSVKGLLKYASELVDSEKPEIVVVIASDRDGTAISICGKPIDIAVRLTIACQKDPYFAEMLEMALHAYNNVVKDKNEVNHPVLPAAKMREA